MYDMKEGSFNNTIDMFRRISMDHGHLWTMGDKEDQQVSTFEHIIENSTAFDIAWTAARALSLYVSGSVKDMPAPHNTGIEFSIPDHTTMTGRERWLIQDNDNDKILYTVRRPLGYVLILCIYRDRKVSVTLIKPEELEDRHIFCAVNAMLALGINPEGMPEFVTREVWQRYLKEVLDVG